MSNNVQNLVNFACQKARDRRSGNVKFVPQRETAIMHKPNFFIVGAPKAGTTSLSSYLSDHPQVFIPKNKEPSFFVRRFIIDERRLRLRPYLRSEEGYLELFSEVKEQHKAIGDASVNYLRFSEALEDIKRFNPEAKIIVLVRNPVDLVQSLHAQLLYEFRETERDFARAWRLQFDREQGHHLPISRLFYDDLLYGRMAKLGEQLERLLQIFPLDQIKIILFEDFMGNPQNTYCETLKFLEIQKDERSFFPVFNQRRAHKHEVLGRAYNTLPIWMRFFIRRTKQSLGIESFGINRLLKRVNTKAVTPAKLETEFSRELNDYFAEDITKLECILGCDLSHWRCHSALA